MACSITTERTDAYAVVVVAGELDLGSAGELTAALAAAHLDAPELVVDLSALDFIDSTGLAELLAQATLAERAGRRLKLVAPAGGAARIFELTGTAGRFTWVPSPGALETSPLPHRVARHRAALAAIAQVADDPDGPEAVSRLVADAAGDACLLSRIDGERLVVVGAAHRRPAAQARLRRAVDSPASMPAPTLWRRLASGPLFVGGDALDDLHPGLEPYTRARKAAWLACLPVTARDGAPTGLLSALRDDGNPPYDEEDRVFLGHVADLLGGTGPLAGAAARRGGITRRAPG